MVSVVAPDGVKLFEVDSPNRFAGEETATIAAQQNGLYRIEIRSVDKTAPTGRYAIRLDKFLTESEYVAERLAAVGRLWGLIKYFHPHLAYKDIDWDGALVHATPQIKAARTPNEYRHAIGNLLQVLNDPATTFVPVSIEDSHSASSPTTLKAPTYFRIVDDHVIINASDWAKARVNRDPAASGKQGPMMAEIAKANQMSFPSEEYRLLALFRFWNVINYFFPYKHLTDKPWGTVLTSFIPRFLENKNQLDYEVTVAEMVAQLQDTHGFVGPLKSLDEHLGGFAPPLSLRVASGKLTIVNLLDEKAAQAAGVKVGDSIIAVDGEPIEQRIAYLSKFKALSNSASAYRFIHPFALRGAKDSKLKLRIEGTAGRIRDVEIARTVPLGNVAPVPPSKMPIYQVLANGYGYIDLARLPLADAHKAMDAVMNAPALIFDMRGYPNATAWEIGPRLSERKNFAVARFRRPFHTATTFDDEDLEGSEPDYSFEQKMPSPKGAIYKGKVVVLINEDAISQSEHTCLFFEAATNVTFIGSATDGANGDITNLVLPGGIYVTFSGHDVRHADGRQLQRVGIQPHVKIEPTPKGIRDGRDEVFEAAVKYLDSALKK